MPAGQPVIHTPFGPAGMVGQIDGRNDGSLALEDLCQAFHRLAHQRLVHHVRVENDAHRAVLPGNEVEIRQDGCRAKFIAPFEVPDAE